MEEKKRLPEFQLTEQQKRDLRRLAHIAKMFSARSNPARDYTESQLDDFARELCMHYRILSKPAEYQENETIKEQRRGHIKLLSTVVTKKHLTEFCPLYRRIDCQAKNCPAWKFRCGGAGQEDKEA